MFRQEWIPGAVVNSVCERFLVWFDVFPADILFGKDMHFEVYVSVCSSFHVLPVHLLRQYIGYRPPEIHGNPPGWRDKSWLESEIHRRLPRCQHYHYDAFDSCVRGSQRDSGSVLFQFTVSCSYKHLRDHHGHALLFNPVLSVQEYEDSQQCLDGRNAEWLHAVF